MDDLISKKAAIKAFTGKPPEYYHTDYIASELRCLPAVDAAPVVRCRDCIHWQEPFDSNNTGYLVAHCDMFKDGDAFHERFYCAHGERRDDDAAD